MNSCSGSRLHVLGEEAEHALHEEVGGGVRVVAALAELVGDLGELGGGVLGERGRSSASGLNESGSVKTRRSGRGCPGWAMSASRMSWTCLRVPVKLV